MMMKFKELTRLNAEERKVKQRELELELIKMNTQVATGTPPKNAGMVSRIKKDIARLLLLEKLSNDKEKRKPAAQETIKAAAKTAAQGTKPKQK
jgi:ribosomal protein L29